VADNAAKVPFHFPVSFEHLKVLFPRGLAKPLKSHRPIRVPVS
jgi:hypothetical protein